MFLMLRNLKVCKNWFVKGETMLLWMDNNNNGIWIAIMHWTILQD